MDDRPAPTLAGYEPIRAPSPLLAEPVGGPRYPYTGPVNYPLSTLLTAAADPRNRNVVIGIVAPVDDDGRYTGPPFLVVTAGIDAYNRVNMRVNARDLSGNPVGGIGRGNSVS
jgi:hypothetical protein